MHREAQGCAHIHKVPRFVGRGPLPTQNPTFSKLQASILAYARSRYGDDTHETLGGHPISHEFCIHRGRSDCLQTCQRRPIDNSGHSFFLFLVVVAALVPQCDIMETFAFASLSEPSPALRGSMIGIQMGELYG